MKRTITSLAVTAVLMTGGALASPAMAATSPSPAPSHGGFAQLRTCLAAHGIKLPQRPAGTPGQPNPSASGGGRPGGHFLPSGVTQQQFRAAMQACGGPGLGFGHFGAGPGGAVSNSSAFAAFRSCLQDHGVSLPANGKPGNFKRNDPTVQAAMKTCSPLMPSFGPRPSPTK